MTLSVIVVAAGSGDRLGLAVPKAFASVAGRTLLEHSLEPLKALGANIDVVIVAPAGWETPASAVASDAYGSPVTVVTGGDSRTASVRRGLAEIAPSSTRVLIHDAARAFTPTEVFARVIGALDKGVAGVIPVLPAVDTIVPVDHDTGATGIAHPRETLGIVQTPQGFDTSALRQAYEAFAGDATDDAEVMRATGAEVVAVAGHSDSAKVTYPDDLARAEARMGSGSSVLVGTGVDVHQFDSDKLLVVGGVEFPGLPGLAGHSDGDVVIHAIIDALLAAAGLGDLGTHFGVDRPEFAGVASTTLLERALELVATAGYRPQSVSVQYIGNHPKIGPVRESMSQSLSALVGAPVHVAGTTTDGLGLTGRGEGAAAIATALVVRQPGSRALAD